jgi:hypothetical protein
MEITEVQLKNLINGVVKQTTEALIPEILKQVAASAYPYQNLLKAMRKSNLSENEKYFASAMIEHGMHAKEVLGFIEDTHLKNIPAMGGCN